MKLKRDPSYLLGQLTGLALIGGFTAALIQAAGKAWRRSSEAIEMMEEESVQPPLWRTLTGEITACSGGELLVDDGVTAIRFTIADVPVLDARSGQPVAELPTCGTVAVVYDANAPMAMSLPPLSNGAVSILVNPVPADMLPLRANAEAKGYQLSWLGFQSPITLTRGDITLELLLDSDELTYFHRSRDIHPLDRMERLSQPVRLDGSVLMVPADLIAALL